MALVKTFPNRPHQFLLQEEWRWYISQGILSLTGLEASTIDTLTATYPTVIGSITTHTYKVTKREPCQL